MCISWFKKGVKLNNTDEIMTTIINKNVKLDTNIDIPENYVGLFYYHDTYILTLQSGSYKLQGDLFYKIIDKNKRKNRDIKKPSYNFNIHYISIKRHNITISFNHFSSFKQKVTYVLTATYEINDVRKFASELLTTWYKTNNKRTLRYINNWFKEFCSSCLEKKFNETKRFETQLLDMAKKHFKIYGLGITDISLQTSNGNDKYPNSSAANMLNNINITPTIDNGMKEHTTVKESFCPNCQCKIIEGSDFCHRCGYSFNKNTIFRS